MRQLLAAALFLFAAAPAGAARLERGPYLESMTSKMATVRFRVDAATPAWLTYGAAPDCERFQTMLAAAKEQRLPLFGLTPDTTHCYRLYLPAGQSTGAYKAFEGTFTTFREEDKPYFSFLAFGESGSGSEEQLELAARMDAFRPDFVLHTGGIVDSGLDADADEQYFKPYAGLLARTPFFIALGNRDYGRDFRKEAGRGFLKANFTPFHSVPLTGLPPHYYFFDAGNARIFVLDGNAFDGAKFAPPLTPGSKQYKWLEYFLGKTNREWKIAVLAQPLYSTGSRGDPAERLAALEPLFLKYKVDLVLQGGNNNYERTKPVKQGVSDEENGIVYVTLGGGGMAPEMQRRNEEWSDKFLPVYHFAVVEVKGKDLDMTVYGADGSVLDEFEVQK
ncbi:MAG: metallophosphoesterase [Elusimicrobiota bacterium]